MVKALENTIVCKNCSSVLQYENDDIIIDEGIVSLFAGYHLVRTRKIHCPICHNMNTIDSKIIEKI